MHAAESCRRATIARGEVRRFSSESPDLSGTVCYFRRQTHSFEYEYAGSTPRDASMPKKISRNSFDNTSSLLDATNIEILRALLDEPRLAMSELGRRIGMSAPAVTERVQRMQDAG